MAGFEVTINGRFWVTAEERIMSPYCYEHTNPDGGQCGPWKPRILALMGISQHVETIEGAIATKHFRKVNTAGAVSQEDDADIPDFDSSSRDFRADGVWAVPDERTPEFKLICKFCGEEFSAPAGMIFCNENCKNNFYRLDKKFAGLWLPPEFSPHQWGLVSKITTWVNEFVNWFLNN